MPNVKHKIRKEDLVQVIAGKERGKQGKVLKINHENGRVIVSGLNMVKKAMKKKSQTDRGGIVEIEAPIHISNVMIVCKKCNNPFAPDIRSSMAKEEGLQKMWGGTLMAAQTTNAAKRLPQHNRRKPKPMFPGSKVLS